MKANTKLFANPSFMFGVGLISLKSRRAQRITKKIALAKQRIERINLRGYCIEEIEGKCPHYPNPLYSRKHDGGRL